MNTVTFTVEGVGLFVVQTEPTLLQRTKIEMRVKSFFGSQYTEILRAKNECLSIINQMIMEKLFVGRSLESLMKDEFLIFAKAFAEEASPEKQRLDEFSYMLSSVEFLYTFAETCSSFPAGMTKESFPDLGEEVTYKIWSAYLQALQSVESKKKITETSSI